MANTYKNILITPNTGSAIGDPTIVFSGGNTTVNTDVTLRVYPDSNGTLSFEGAAGQLFSITNDLSNSIFAVNDVTGIPLIEVNVSSQQITLGEFYGNVGVGKSSSTSSTYKLDVNGTINASNVLINGSPITGVANLTPANGYVNTSTTAANNYAGAMANAANGYATTINDANLVVARAYTNTSTTAANNYAGVMANSVNAYANTLGTNTSLAYSWTNNHTFSANVFYRNTSNLVWITNSASTVSNVTLRNYPDSNGTLSFEGSAGQLFSITNDLSGSIFAVNDVTGIPLIEVNVTSQQVTFGQFYGNVGIGTNASTDSIYKLDVAGSANISSPTLLVAGQNVIASFASGNNYAGAMANSGNAWTQTIVDANLVTARAYTNTSTTAANNYAGAMANSGNAWTQTIVDANLVTARAYTNTSTTAANNYAGAMANSANVFTGTVYAAVNSSFAVINAAYTSSNANFTVSNAAFTVANAAFGSVNTVGGFANTAGINANQAGVIANAAFAAANQAGVVANNSNTFAGSTYVKKSGDTITGDLVVQGNVTISGNTTYANSQTLLIGDALITLNNDIPAAVAPSEDAGIEIKRGSSANVALLWNEGSDKWTFTNDGTNYRLIASNTDVESANNYAGAMANSGNAITYAVVSANLDTARAYTNTSTTAANNYAGAMANSANAITYAVVSANLDTARAYTNTSTTAANNYAGAMANSANARADTKLANTSGVSFAGDLFFPTGNIGIGTAAPSANLHVVGTANITAGIVSTGNITTTSTITAQHFDNVSDIILKENIEPIKNALNTLEKLNPVNFSWKKDGSVSFGLIAQEVEKILPEIVHQSEGSKTVSYTQIIALLIAAIKELNTKLDDLT